MKPVMEPKCLTYSGLVKDSIHFFGAHFVFLFVAGLIAALGRSIQLGALGAITGGLDTLLEFIIEIARILTFLLVIGEGSVGKGVNRIKSLFALNWSQWKSIYSIVGTRIKTNWIALLTNLLIYSVIAFIINFIIDKVAYDTKLLITLQNSNILAPHT